jgi:hypothetical protein
VSPSIIFSGAAAGARLRLVRDQRRRTAGPSRLAALVLVCVATAAGTARGQEPSPDVQSRRDFESGLRSYNAGDYRTAIELFQSSYQRSNAPGLLYNIAQAHRLRGDCARALVFYRRYLATEPGGGIQKRAEGRAIEMEACVRGQGNRASAAEDRAADDYLTLLPAAPPPTQPPALSPAALRASEGRAGLPGDEVMVRRAGPEASPSLAQRWWFWAGIGAVVVAGAVAAAMTTRLFSHDAACPSGHRCM